MSSPAEILDFWFGEPTDDPEVFKEKITRWYRGGPTLDREIAERFQSTIERALAGELDDWPATLDGRLALVLVLDQFPRSVFRGTARAYEGDAKAQRLALEALDAGLDSSMTLEQRLFLAMPLLHSERPELHARSPHLLERLVADAPPALRPIYGMSVDQAYKYQAIIARFGRFPHRNEPLDRTSTAAEMDFLSDWQQKAAPANFPKGS